jgi:hypothetical protein
MTEEKEIDMLAGETEESVIVLQFRLDKHLSLSGDEYSKPAFSEEEGEERAREYLEDGELWKMAVEADNTTQSLDDWIEDVLNNDGWQQTLGDISETKDGKYVSLTSCGQIDMHIKPENFTKVFIPKEDLEFIFKSWKQYHLKDLTEIPIEVTERLSTIFNVHKSNISDWNSEATEEEE